MSKKWLFIVALLVFSLVSIALAQNRPETIFEPYRQIGSLRPSGIEYDPNFDRMAMVDLRGQLVLADAASYQTQHILYKSGAYNAYIFSHDGRYLALAIDRRVELWDTQTGELSVKFEPDGALLVQGPLHFTPDDTLLLLDTVVPAPQATRQSENDTEIIPWLWDVRAARREGRTQLPGSSESYAFFAFRNGLVIGPNHYLVAGVPSRLQIINGNDKSFPVVTEVESTRLERDPIYVWRSMTDDFMYIDPQVDGQITQFDTQTGSAFTVPLERDLNYTNLESLQGLGLSNIARVIGESNTQTTNSFLRLLLGNDYLSSRNYQHSTVYLLDILQPLTMPESSTGLLIYNFNNDIGRGVLELISPPDVQKMVLNPDHNRLMVRRASGAQPIEVYNLDSGLLEKSYYPAELDGGGNQLLAYNGDGSVILNDFERFDVQSGEVVNQIQQYTTGFEQYFFTDDSRKLVTIRGNQWTLWDIETGQILQQEKVVLNGSIIRQSPDAFRFLTQFTGNNGEVMEIVDISADEHKHLEIPYLPGRSIESITPSADWQNYLVVYSATPGTQHYPGNEIAIYNFNRGKLLFIAGDDLPQPDGRQYGWLDERTIFVSSYNPDVRSQPERIYGLEYHSSGLPYCLIRAFPEQWRGFAPVWESLTLNLRSDQLGHLTQRLCATLPDSADALAPALTPTLATPYYADVTAIPIAVPGVPTCLTSRFQREALDYAALWRSMTDGLPPEQIQSLATMLCEGLINSVSGVAATPTTDPNQLNPPTETPLAGGPSTTDFGSDQRLEVMSIDIESGQRSVGAYIPPHEAPPRDISILFNLFIDMQGYAPNNLVLSPDGTIAAITDNNGFIILYKLKKTFDQLMTEENAAFATRQAEAPRSIGLVATATPTFEVVGQVRPTLTPTITPTPPPLPEATAQRTSGEVQEICPTGDLYDISAPPPDYAAIGRVFVPPVANLAVPWVLDVSNGKLYPDDALPRCPFTGECTFSFDQEWMLLRGDSIIISRPDGSDAFELFRPEERPEWPQDIRWTNLHTLQYTTQGYVPDKRDPVTLITQFDPVSQIRSEPFQPPASIKVDGLPTTLVSEQPANGSLILVTTPYQNGGKYYIYDRATGEADYFTRVDDGSLDFVWHPLGRFLYYRPAGQNNWYVFDTRTRQHSQLGSDLGANLNGPWSHDGRYNVSWFTVPSEEFQKRVDAGQRLPKISIWDTETGVTRRYCIPETGRSTYGNTSFIWSPDNRYLIFNIALPTNGDYFPTPTTTPDIPVPTSTPLPLEVQYQYQHERTVVLDTQTGTVTILSKEIGNPILWTDEGDAS